MIDKFAFTTENSNVETADAIGLSGKVYELSKFDNPERAAFEMSREIASGSPEIAASRTNGPGNQGLKLNWLPFAAEKLGISPKAKDYVAVPVTLMCSALPNRNLVAFPTRRIFEFDISSGRLAYQSFFGQPTHKDHANEHPDQAKGVVMDVGVRPLRGYKGDLYKIIALCAFDRTRDPITVNKILSSVIDTYSLGAMVRGYSCSICGVETGRPTEPKCMHIPANRRVMNAFPVRGENKLAYWNTGPFKGFEVSALEKALPGAFPSTDATTDGIIDLAKVRL